MKMGNWQEAWQKHSSKRAKHGKILALKTFTKLIFDPQDTAICFRKLQPAFHIRSLTSTCWSSAYSLLIVRLHRIGQMHLFTYAVPCNSRSLLSVYSFQIEQYSEKGYINRDIIDQKVVPWLSETESPAFSPLNLLVSIAFI